MRRPSPLWLVALLGIFSIAFVCAAAPSGQGGAFAGQEEEEEYLDIPELDTVRGHIMDLEREEAEDALKEAKKELRKRKREKGVKAAIEKMEKNIDALEEFEKAQEYKEAGKAKKALKSVAKVLRGYGEILFADQAESVYAELKQEIYYIINDFETEELRDPKNFRTSQSGAETEIVSGARFSSDGRHALKIHFDERGENVRERDPGSYRGAELKTPETFSRDLEELKALTFSVFSYEKTPAKVTLVISGGGAESFAAYAGIVLNFAGWKHYQVRLNEFRFNGSFQWRDARSIVFSTRGLAAVDFIVDDVKFHR